MKRVDYYNFFFSCKRWMIKLFIIKKNRVKLLNRAKEYHESSKERWQKQPKNKYRE